MIDHQLLKTDEGFERVLQSLAKRGDTASAADLKEAAEKRRLMIREVEALSNERNVQSKKLGELKAQGKQAEFDALRETMKDVADRLKALKEEEAPIEERFQNLLARLPNILDEKVPAGKDETENVVVRTVGEIPQFDFEVKPHYEIAESQSLVDFERGVKISGARFYVYNEQIARLERQLANLMLDLHAEAGYKERMVPLLVKDECMFGTGQFPKFNDEYYRMEKDGLSLIPTGEVPLTNLYADEILNAAELPIKLTAFTPCFRREAGSAGKDTRGLVRVHQFNKVELVKFVRPEESEKEWISLTHDAERVLQKLGLTYRVLSLCSGDMGFTSSITYDLEIYMPGLKRWLEISSCSNFKDFQARRAKIRYKNEAGKNEYVHTINGSGVAAGRLVAALLEYHQTPFGKVDWRAIEAKLKS
ncbi:serine--tRNA ligase [Turneriella parva]|uniref:Serine--tRNA ligase n=1 Tax=Turneriella parva (strain ATCC BAA-1111 / DSM 21527 / NCTC 11395 / H) TaxID=869212 RepID=I4B1K2_TURPD|nr:serine--tRNA ligase [Turneriella parva]AFM11159.1 seryl-tRNA synthetase [Turneriella parva DSM 21527]